MPVIFSRKYESGAFKSEATARVRAVFSKRVHVSSTIRRRATFSSSFATLTARRNTRNGKMPASEKCCAPSSSSVRRPTHSGTSWPAPALTSIMAVMKIKLRFWRAVSMPPISL